MEQTQILWYASRFEIALITSLNILPPATQVGTDTLTLSQWTWIILQPPPQPLGTCPIHNRILRLALIHVLHTLHQPLAATFIAANFPTTHLHHARALAKSNCVCACQLAPPHPKASQHTLMPHLYHDPTNHPYNLPNISKVAPPPPVPTPVAAT